MQSQHSAVLAGLAAGSACGAALFHYFHVRGEATPTPEPIFPLQRFLRRFYGEPRIFVLAENGGPLTARLRITPGDPVAFAGETALTCEVGLTLAHGNAEVATNAVTFYLDPATGRLRGCSAERAHGVFTEGGSLPDDATLGTEGEFFAARMYATPEASEPAYRILARYEVIENPALAPGRALLRVDTRYAGPDESQAPRIAQTVLYGIDVAGGIDIRRTILYLPDKTLVFGAA